MEELKYFLDFTFQSFWIFLGVILLIGATGQLLRGLFSFVPKRIHIGKKIYNMNSKDSKDLKDTETQINS